MSVFMSVSLDSLYILFGATYIFAVPEDHLRICSLLQCMDHLIRTHPVIVVSCQPPLWCGGVVVVADMVLVGCEDPGTGLSEVDLSTN
jgi:hypothetical protein